MRPRPASAEAVKPGGIVHQDFLKQCAIAVHISAQQIHQITIVGHIAGDIGMRPVGAPKQVIRRHFDQLLRERDDIVERRAVHRQTLGAGDLDPSATTERMRIDTSGGEVSGNFTDTSDEGFKENIEPMSEGNGLDLINQLNPVIFDWRPEKARGDNSTEQSGFIAQEVEQQKSTLVFGKDVAQNPNGSGKSISTVGIVAHLTKAIQELSVKVEEQAEEIEMLKN